MNSKANITAIILTYNEEAQIERCIKSVNILTNEIFIIDSFSTDKTKSVAENLGAKVFQQKWLGNQARQFNWGLDNLPIKTEWVLRLDADEYLLPALVVEINEKLPLLKKDTSGVMLKRRVHFMNKWIKHGGYYPTYLLRIWRFGSGKFEERWMDEHVKLNQGKTIAFENDFVDDNLNNLTWWTEKHNNYATREAIDLLNIKYNFSKTLSIDADISKEQDKRKRWIKENLYFKIPLFIRPLLYFIYRYFFRFGFLDGKPGLIWHFLQGLWYRFLVDTKVFDIERRAKQVNKSVVEIVKTEYGIDV